MSQDTPTTPAPTHQQLNELIAKWHGLAIAAFAMGEVPIIPSFADSTLAALQFAASLVRREELLVAALETIRSEAAFGLSFGAGNDVGNKDAALRSIYRITTAPVKPTEAP